MVQTALSPIVAQHEAPREEKHGQRVEHDEHEGDQIEAHRELHPGLADGLGAAFVVHELHRIGPRGPEQPGHGQRHHAEGDDDDGEDQDGHVARQAAPPEDLTRWRSIPCATAAIGHTTAEIVPGASEKRVLAGPHHEDLQSIRVGMRCAMTRNRGGRMSPGGHLVTTARRVRRDRCRHWVLTLDRRAWPRAVSSSTSTTPSTTFSSTGSATSVPGPSSATTRGTGAAPGARAALLRAVRAFWPRSPGGARLLALAGYLAWRAHAPRPRHRLQRAAHAAQHLGLLQLHVPRPPPLRGPRAARRSADTSRTGRPFWWDFFRGAEARPGTTRDPKHGASGGPPRHLSPASPRRPVRASPRGRPARAISAACPVVESAASAPARSPDLQAFEDTGSHARAPAPRPPVPAGRAVAIRAVRAPARPRNRHRGRREIDRSRHPSRADRRRVISRRRRTCP